jgi:hypothetical protein
MTPNSEKGVYKPSWIDRFGKRVEGLPVRPWIFYAGFGIALILVQLLFLWLDSGLQAEELLPIIVFNGLAIPFLLALIHLLDNLALTSLSSMRPVLDMTGPEFDDYAFRLSNMPFLAPLLAGVAVTALTILSPLVSTAPIRYAALEQLPVFGVVFHLVDKGSAFIVGVFLYHTIRQLRLVNAINARHIRVNLFHLRPLQAFSRLTALTAFGFLVFVYLWMIINPELLADPLLFGYVVAFTLAAVLVFVWPLWGAHKLIQTEKEKALHEIDRHFETVFSSFNQSIHEADYAATERLVGTVSSLDIQRKRISDIDTWPWSSDTARIALTAIALPLILMIIQFFVLQALDR